MTVFGAANEQAFERKQFAKITYVRVNYFPCSRRTLAPSELCDRFKITLKSRPTWQLAPSADFGWTDTGHGLRRPTLPPRSSFAFSVLQIVLAKRRRQPGADVRRD